MSIDTLNRHMVAVHRGRIVIGRPPSHLTPQEALVFAAYLVTMAEIQGTLGGGTLPRFDDVLKAVRNA